MKTTNMPYDEMGKNASIEIPYEDKRQGADFVKSFHVHTKKRTHEENVEKFFSHGSELRANQENGFLSFGYWTKHGQNYYQAAEDLLELLLSNEMPLNRGIVLDVACGFGSETFRIYDCLKPEKIIAIDITSAHIEHAQKKVVERNLTNRIVFEKQDACILPFQSKSFAYVIGVEGPSQFNTREQFLKRAYDVLEPNGVLLLTDVIVHKDVAQKSWLNRRISNILSKQWYMPAPNWMNFERYRQMLVDIGFKVDFIKGIGTHVYPGFARFNLKWSSIKNAIRVRGFNIGLGLTFISWLLEIASKKEMLDYAFIRAVKQ
jgi:ubiquinone/menaquinone biosynthesis C-methylase UbiE